MKYKQIFVSTEARIQNVYQQMLATSFDVLIIPNVRSIKLTTKIGFYKYDQSKI